MPTAVALCAGDGVPAHPGTAAVTVTTPVVDDAVHPFALVTVSVKLPLVAPIVTAGLCEVALGS